VYIIRSDADPERHYVGITQNVDERLDWHNHGPCGHTVNNRPWSLIVSIEFRNERDAVRFEKYLKSARSCRGNVSPIRSEYALPIARKGQLIGSCELRLGFVVCHLLVHPADRATASRLGDRR